MSRNKSMRKPTGGVLNVPRKKKKYNFASETIFTKLGPAKVKAVRTRGGTLKFNVLSASYANVIDPKTGKSQKAEIKTVSANPADSQFVRRNIVTKNAVIVTSAGKARVTSRPGQDGVVNAVLIKE
ncbi:MAG: 30S ribosomal protein S8e [Candidatus Aenigmatarchaeota archaeon]|nr:MAG: 30S ribosomal protein S8e [Candidatus Aenigmarchaeota archaeon]